MNRARIMLVDDEEECLRTMRLALVMEGYEVTAFSRAEDAAAVLLGPARNETPCDLLITDIQMPGLKGDELIARLRNAGVNIPVAVITAYGNKDLLRKLMRKGCDELLDKPVPIGTLTGVVRDLLERARASSAAQRQAAWLTELGAKAEAVIRDLDNFLQVILVYTHRAMESAPDNWELRNHHLSITGVAEVARGIARKALVDFRSEEQTEGETRENGETIGGLSAIEGGRVIESCVGKHFNT